MNNNIRLAGFTLCLLTLLVTGVKNAYAATDDPTFILRPHCSEGYQGDAWIFGDIAPPGWNTAEDSNLCPPFEIEDPQTLRTPILKVGDTLDLDLVVQNPGAKPISSVRIWLNYDSTILEGLEIRIDGSSFTEITPGEADFASEEGYIKIQASIPGKDASTAYWVPVARITLTAKGPVSPGAIVNFYDVQADGHTYILSKGDTGKEKYALGQEPGSLLVRIAQSSPETEDEDETETDPLEGLLECAEDLECNGAICFQGFCRAEEFRVPDGGECRGDDQCFSGSCTDGFCAATNRFLDGEFCLLHEECASGVCTDGICTASTEPIPQADTLCSEDAQCPVGKNCIDGLCQEPQGIIPTGGTCVLSTQCTTNLCVEGICKDPETHKNDRTAFSLLQIRNVRVTSEGGSAFVKWNDLRSSSLKTYNIYYGTTSGEYIQRKVVPGIAPSVTLRNLPEGTTYYFAVRAANISDEESAFSQEVAVEIGNPSTSTAPLVASLFTDAPGVNPITDTAIEMPGETGTSSVVVLLVLFSAVIGTILASRRQIIASA